ncbi:MAG: hypothetical protein K2X99_01445, partial [Gemmatimonadaceae bacterium]|nr:hypothetical protein [Gemmatimonadaceae bacterium]
RAAARGWNFGPHEADVISVRAVADAFTRALGARWEQDGGAHPHEAATLNLSWARAADALGWAPRWRLDEAIARTAAWYRAWGAHRHVSAPDELVAAIDADLDAFARSAA